MKKLIIMSITILLAASLCWADEAGKISQYQGNVLVYDGTSPRGTNVEAENMPLMVNYKIATKKDASAVIDLLGGDRVALDERAVMTIEGIEQFKPESGKVVFHIKKRGQASGVKIALTSAVIGVKGTRFLIDTDEKGKNDIFLKDGVIEVTALEGEFKKYKEVVMDEYEAYVKQMSGEYDEYVKKLEEEYVEYVKGFTMEPGQGFSVSGNEVRKLEYTPEVDDAFNLLHE